MLREAVSALGPPAGIRVWLACARTDMRNVRTEHAPANFCTIKHMAQDLIRLAPGKVPCGSRERRPAGMTSSSPA